MTSRNRYDGTLTSIGSYVFYGCTGLTSVAIPNSVMSIRNSASYGCSSLTNINMLHTTRVIYTYCSRAVHTIVYNLMLKLISKTHKELITL